MIYFIQAGENGPIKIGKTEDIDRRLAQLQTASAYELKLLWVYSGSRWTEIKIHEKFNHERIRGEWFRPARTIYKFIDKEMANEIEFAPVNLPGHEIVIREMMGGVISVDGDFGGICIFKDGRIEIDRYDESQNVTVRSNFSGKSVVV